MTVSSTATRAVRKAGLNNPLQRLVLLPVLLLQHNRRGEHKRAFEWDGTAGQGPLLTTTRGD